MKKIITLVLASILIICFTTACSKLKEQTGKQLEKTITNTEDKEQKENINNIADEIKLSIKKVENKKDYEEKNTLVLQIQYENLGKKTKIIDSEDIKVLQDGYILKSVYDNRLNTEAFYKELKPKQIKTFKIGYRLERDKEIKLVFSPFLSKNKVTLDVSLDS